MKHHWIFSQDSFSVLFSREDVCNVSSVFKETKWKVRNLFSNRVQKLFPCHSFIVHSWLLQLQYKTLYEIYRWTNSLYNWNSYNRSSLFLLSTSDFFVHLIGVQFQSIHLIEHWLYIWFPVGRKYNLFCFKTTVVIFQNDSEYLSNIKTSKNEGKDFSLSVIL